MEGHFRAFDRKDVAKQLEVKAGKLSVADYKKWRVGQMAIGKRWEDMKDIVAKDLTNTTNIAKSMTNGYMPEVYALNANYATFDIEKKTRMDTSFTLYNTDAVERLMRDDPDLLPPPGKRMTEKIRTGKAIKWEQGQIQSVTTQAILQGESVPNMAKRIANTLCVKDQKAAVRYARTAITEAENAGRLDSYKRAEAMGIKLRKMWLATADGHTRDWHVDLDGQTVRVEEHFTNKYGDIDYPGDPGADPLNVWNCRCTMVSQIEGFERNPADLSLRPYNKLGGMSYDDWKSARRTISDISPTSVLDLSRPVRPRKDDYGGYTEEFQAARDAYKEQIAEYNRRLDEAVKNSADATAFSNFDEANKWAEKNGITIDPSVASQIDIRSFNEVKPTLEELFKRFPEVKNCSAEGFSGERIEFPFSIGLTNDGMLSANGGFNFNPRLFGNYENGLRDALDSIADGTLVRGDGSFKTLVRHEYGHNVQNYVEFKMRDKYHMGVDDWRKNYSTFEEFTKARDKYHEENAKYRKELLSLAGLNGSSEYSNTNELELFAEGFAEWSSGGKSEFGTEFGKFLKRWY